MFKRLVPILFVLLTALYLTKGLWAPHPKEASVNVAGGFQVPVSVAVARYGNLSEQVELPVDIKAMTEVKVIPTFLGRIERFYVHEGDAVKKGDMLLKYAGPQEGEDGFFDDLVVRAPIAGVVSAVLKDAGMNAEKDMPLLTVSSVDTVRAVLNLPSEYAGMLSADMQARIQVDAVPGRAFTGTLKTVRPQVDPVSRTSYVEFLIDNAAHDLLPGMAGMVSFRAGNTRSGLVVPMVSVFVENGKTYVYGVVQNKAVKRTVRIIQEGIEDAVLEGDLRAGMQVLTVRPDSLKDGDTVYIVK